MVVLVMGVSGSGKSTVGRALAEAVGGRFYDADDFHSAANVDKMRSGEPLTDSDREPWLRTLRTMMDAWLLEDGVFVLACSALTERIRDALGAHREGVHVVFLSGSKELIDSRMRDREHYMPAALLDSQLALLEPPAQALRLDIGEPVDHLVNRVVRELSLS